MAILILILPLRILYRDDRLELNWTEYIGNSFSYVLEDLDVSLYAENLRTVHKSTIAQVSGSKFGKELYTCKS